LTIFSHSAVQNSIKTILHTGSADEGAVFEVTWSPEPNVLRKTSSSIEKYGEEGAFQKAVAPRQKIEKKIYGRVIQTEIPPFQEVKARLDEKQFSTKPKRKKKI
jgi:hypothetical protein